MAISVAALFFLGLAAFFGLRVKRVEAERDAAAAERDAEARTRAEVQARFSGVVDADAERSRVLAQLAAERSSFAAEIVSLQNRRDIVQGAATETASRVESLKAALGALEEKADLMEMGYYEPHFDFDTSQNYRDAVEKNRTQQKTMLKEGTAATGGEGWTVNGSLKEGAKMTKQNVRLMLRAFNGDCDAAVASVRFNNITTMQARIEKSFTAINDLNSVNRTAIGTKYLDLKIAEIRLAHELAEKIQAEKEEQRAIREQMREEERARCASSSRPRKKPSAKRPVTPTPSPRPGPTSSRPKERSETS